MEEKADNGSKMGAPMMREMLWERNADLCSMQSEYNV